MGSKSRSAAVDDDLYEVEKILDERVTAKNVKEYLVRWVGWSPKWDSWEPEDNLESCHDLIDKFLKSRPGGADSVNGKSGSSKAQERENNASSSASCKEATESPSTSAVEEIDNEESPEATPAPANEKPRRQRPQRQFWEMVSGEKANTLRDPFWKNLEEGKIDLGGDGLYERVKRRRGPGNQNETEMAPKKSPQKKGPVPKTRSRGKKIDETSELDQSTNLDEAVKVTTGTPAKKVKRSSSKKNRGKETEKSPEDQALANPPDESADGEEATMDSEENGYIEKSANREMATIDSEERNGSITKSAEREIDSEESNASIPKSAAGPDEVQVVGSVEYVEDPAAAEKTDGLLVPAKIEETEVQESSALAEAQAATDEILSTFEQVAEEASRLLLQSLDHDLGDGGENREKDADGSISCAAKSSLSSGGQWLPMKRDSIPKKDSKAMEEDQELNLIFEEVDTSLDSVQAPQPTPLSTIPKESAAPMETGNLAMASASSSSVIPESPTEQASTEIFVPGLPLPISTGLSLSEFFKKELRLSQLPSDKVRLLTTFTEFEQACYNGDVESVRQALLSKKRMNSAVIDVNARNTITSNPILMHVCFLPCDPSHSLDDIIDLLASNGANLNIRNDSGDTALTMAIKQNQQCKVTKLLSLGAAINLPNHLGETPLMIACKKNFSNIVFRLLEHGADFNAQSADGKTALDIAKELTLSTGSNSCEAVIRARSDNVNQAFDQQLRLVVKPETFTILKSLFPLHCYALNESNAFRIVFYYDDEPTKPTSDMAWMITIGMARFMSNQVAVRFWGPTPVKKVLLNNVEQAPVTSDGKFIFTMWPIKQGLNDLVITCNADCKQSQHKLLIDAFAVKTLGEVVDSFVGTSQ